MWNDFSNYNQGNYITGGATRRRTLAKERFSCIICNNCIIRFSNQKLIKKKTKYYLYPIIFESVIDIFKLPPSVVGQVRVGFWRWLLWQRHLHPRRWPSADWPRDPNVEPASEGFQIQLLLYLQSYSNLEELYCRQQQRAVVVVAGHRSVQLQDRPQLLLAPS